MAAKDSAAKDSPKKADADVANASFEDLLTRLSTVVERLERGDLPLEQSLTIFEEGVRLSRLGQKRLDDAERRVELLLRDEDGASSLRPLDKEPETP